ncbi:MAG: four helix bundle protein [Bacteroidetes bacterium]|nr:four helix bundle protein [Bacteroidota bacterium]
MGNTKQNLILDLTYQFALDIIKYVAKLEEGRKYEVARQVLRSGTSIGANAREAQSAESKKDFIHKFKIAHKEVLETEYWLMLCRDSEGYPEPLGLLEQLKTIDNIIGKIIVSTQKINNS